MELGGKSPLIIFDDTHCLDNAVAAAIMANFYSVSVFLVVTIEIRKSESISLL